MVAVFGHKQSLKTRPLCYISQARAKWWVSCGAASSHSRGQSIVLTQDLTLRLSGLSCLMGPNVIEQFAGLRSNQTEIAEVVNSWRFSLA